jgi:hypothetical protein
MGEDRDQLHGVTVKSINAADIESGEAASFRQIRVYYRKKLMIHANVPILNIDADASEEHGAIFWGPYTRHFHLPVKRKAKIVQVADLTFSKSSLLGFEGASPGDAAGAARRLEKLRRFIRAQVITYGRGKVLVVLNKPVRCAITGERREDALPAGVDWEGATIASFGNIRGIDDWKDYHCAIIVGREQASPGAVEDIARALHCDDANPLNLVGEYIDQPHGYRMADGSKLGVKVRAHPENRVQQVLEQMRERENGQAMDRLRMVHRSEPPKVILLGSLPLDATVDRLVTFSDLLLAAEIEAAWRSKAPCRCRPSGWPNTSPAYSWTRGMAESLALALSRRR